MQLLLGRVGPNPETKQYTHINNKHCKLEQNVNIFVGVVTWLNTKPFHRVLSTTINAPSFNKAGVRDDEAVLLELEPELELVLLSPMSASK